LSQRLHMGSSGWWEALYALLIYGAVALVFTGLGMAFGPTAAQVGATRPTDTIPGHLAELAGFGLVLGIVSMAIYGRRGLHLVVLMPALTVLLDIDHLPIYIGYTQTIRPAHSVLFIITALAVTAITIKALDIELVMASAFMGHLAVDTGVFAPFSPLSFAYIQLAPFKLPLAVGALAAAVAAGVVLRRGARKTPGGNHLV
jgi:hypothetical protein